MQPHSPILVGNIDRIAHAHASVIAAHVDSSITSDELARRLARRHRLMASS